MEGTLYVMLECYFFVEIMEWGKALCLVRFGKLCDSNRFISSSSGIEGGSLSVRIPARSERNQLLR